MMIETEVLEIEHITITDGLLECPHCNGVIQEETKVCLNCERDIPLEIVEPTDLNWR